MAAYSIHKYPWGEDMFLPRGARILTIQMQGLRACAWAIVDTDAPLVRRKLVFFGTGFELSSGDPGKYVATVQDPAGYVWHFFDLGEG